MSPDEFITHFEGVKRAGSGWDCFCPNPVHKRKMRRLHIEHNGTAILIHCFACLDTPAILRAVGLELRDLYEKRPESMTPDERLRAREAFRINAWGAALRVLSREATFLQAFAAAIRKGERIAAGDWERLWTAARRIDGAREILAPQWRTGTDEAALRDLEACRRAWRARRAAA